MNINLRRVLIIGVLLFFLTNSLGPVPMARADGFRLPTPGVMVPLSLAFKDQGWNKLQSHSKII